MFSFSLRGGLGDFLAPRSNPKDEFNFLLRTNELSRALALLQSEDNDQQQHHQLQQQKQKQFLWIDDLDHKGVAPLHVACACGAMVREQQQQ